MWKYKQKVFLNYFLAQDFSFFFFPQVHHGLLYMNALLLFCRVTERKSIEQISKNKAFLLFFFFKLLLLHSAITLCEINVQVHFPRGKCTCTEMKGKRAKTFSWHKNLLAALWIDHSVLCDGEIRPFLIMVPFLFCDTHTHLKKKRKSVWIKIYVNMRRVAWTQSEKHRETLVERQT